LNARVVIRDERWNVLRSSAPCLCRRKAAQKLVDRYVYESSNDEVVARSMPKHPRAKPR
jgi:hypothetical protein